MTTTPPQPEGTPKTSKALKATQGLFRVAAEHNGFADHARQLERDLHAARSAIEAMPTCRCGLSTDEQCELTARLHAAQRRCEEMERALQSIAYEAVQHHEHNPVSGKDRLPIGYTKILNLADTALRSPPDGGGNEL